MTTECVGFADCPCRKCRATRREATERHATGHAHGDRPYCGRCITADREAHDSRWGTHAPCPTHAGQWHHKSTGACSCGACHR